MKKDRCLPGVTTTEGSGRRKSEKAPESGVVFGDIACDVEASGIRCLRLTEYKYIYKGNTTRRQKRPIRQHNIANSKKGRVIEEGGASELICQWEILI